MAGWRMASVRVLIGTVLVLVTARTALAQSDDVACLLALCSANPQASMCYSSSSRLCYSSGTCTCRVRTTRLHPRSTRCCTSDACIAAGGTPCPTGIPDQTFVSSTIQLERPCWGDPALQNPCDDGWTGVSCNNAGTFVTRLDLRGAGLTVIPSQLSQCVHLEALNVEDNQLPSLPVELGQLLNLQRLELRFNEFPEAYAFPKPPGLVNCPASFVARDQDCELCSGTSCSTANHDVGCLMAFCEANPQASMCASSGTCVDGVDGKCWADDGSDPCVHNWKGVTCDPCDNLSFGCCAGTFALTDQEIEDLLPTMNGYPEDSSRTEVQPTVDEQAAVEATGMLSIPAACRPGYTSSALDQSTNGATCANTGTPNYDCIPDAGAAPSVSLLEFRRDFDLSDPLVIPAEIQQCASLRML